MKNSGLIYVFVFSLIACFAMGQEEVNPHYKINIKRSEFKFQKGPQIGIDEAHNNLHHSGGLYSVFADVLRKDGYVVKRHKKKISEQSLTRLKIVVIANAIHENNRLRHRKPVFSAFEAEEITALKMWVYNGGSLFLIADHMPFAGASSRIASSFGFEFLDGFVLNKEGSLPDVFSSDNGLNISHEIVQGRNKREKVAQVGSFSGQAFKIPQEATSLLNLDDRHTIFFPDTAFKYYPGTPRRSAMGLSQLAVLDFGEGKVVMCGEATMFTSIIEGKRQMGMGVAGARDNQQLLLNLIHWLGGTI